ncbi:hypothetical protein CCACVL1_19231, partial [Corchorus capsularis]
LVFVDILQMLRRRCSFNNNGAIPHAFFLFKVQHAFMQCKSRAKLSSFCHECWGVLANCSAL